MLPIKRDQFESLGMEASAKERIFHINAIVFSARGKIRDSSNRNYERDHKT
jgi:hypothetical protein